MPWSPVPKFPEIIKSLKNQGYMRQCTLQILYTEIMRVTGIIKEKTLKQTFQAMEQLGYVKLLPSGIVEIEPDREIKEAIAEVKAEEEVDAYMENIEPPEE